MDRAKRQEHIDELVNKVRKESVRIWKLAKEKIQGYERHRRYVCLAVMEAITETVDGVTDIRGKYYGLPDGMRVYQRLVFNECFPEFLEVYNKSMPYSIKDMHHYGWFGKPDDETDKKRLDAMTEMIRLYEYLESVDLLTPDPDLE